MSDWLDLPDDRLAGLGITPTEIADAIEHAVRAQAEGRLWTAPKSSILPGDGRYVMSTLATGDDPAVTVVKSVMVSPDNPARGLPGINGAILVLDSQTGQLRAVMGANWITAVRTAGLSAVVARRLANPGAASIAFLGCGVQARSHLDAFAALFPLREVRAFGRGQANIDALCQAAEENGLAARAVDAPREALDGADLVVSSITLDYTLEPFVDAGWLKPGAFAAITDVARPWMPETLDAFGTIVIDDLEQEAAMEKKLVEPGLVAGDLSGLVLGRVTARFDPAKPAAFIFRGQALGDFAAAALALSRAEAEKS